MTLAETVAPDAVPAKVATPVGQLTLDVAWTAVPAKVGTVTGNDTLPLAVKLEVLFVPFGMYSVISIVPLGVKLTVLLVPLGV